MKTKDLKEIIGEVLRIIVRFFKPYKVKEDLLAVPKAVRNLGFKVGAMELGLTVMSAAFSYVLKLTNLMIEQKLILLGIILFMLYRGQNVIMQSFDIVRTSFKERFDMIFGDEIILRGSSIAGRVSNKVLKFDEKNKLYEIMENEVVLNCLKNFLNNFWQWKCQYVFNIFELISIVVMLATAIITNTEIKQIYFIPLVIVFVLISFFSSAYVGLNRKKFYKENREYDNKQEVIKNDLLRVPEISRRDLEMRIKLFQNTVVLSRNNVKKFHKINNLSYLIITVLETLSQYGLIFFYLINIEWETINLSTITEITATLVIVETALRLVRKIARSFDKNSEMISIIEEEQKDVDLILDMYHKEIAKNNAPRKVEDIKMEPFKVQYLETSENDRPFTLKLESILQINNGQIVVLYGPSGSGKSTFMKLLTERIKIQKDVGIPSTSRFLFYDETMRFGSLSLYEELFCCSDDVDLSKMKEILINLHLWPEIQSNCVDPWQWMKEKKYQNSLSNGQKQRIVLAKMLYWLDDQIDVVVLDECTSGLDDKSSDSDSADAEKILEYIVKYVNKDKKRIVIISTHQNIDGFKEKVADEFTFKNLMFKRGEGCNTIEEI